MLDKRVSTGTGVLDELLEGGFEADAITTIYGPAGAGKTNFAVLAAVETAKKGKKVVFIDTEGGFSAARLKQIVKNPKKVLKNFIFITPTNFEEQKNAFSKLKGAVGKKVGLVVIDTLSMLYRVERSEEAVKEVNRELGVQIGLLNEICRKNKVPVLVTNQVYSSFNSDRVHIVGGDILKYGSKCLLELQNLAGGKRKVTLKKHRSIAGEKQAVYRIVEKGIEKA